MKSLKGLTLFVFVLALASRSYAQKVELLEGDLSPLKSEKSIDITFTYDSIQMGGKGHPSESEYVAKKTAEYNKKEPGKGDTWAKAWKDDRESLYQPAFTKIFQQMSSLEWSPKSKYTMIFKTTYTEPGFNIMVHQEPSQINGIALIVETANKSHVIAKISVMKARGRNFWGNEWNTGERITEAYEAAGSQLGYWMKSKM